MARRIFGEPDEAGGGPIEDYISGTDDDEIIHGGPDTSGMGTGEDLIFGGWGNDTILGGDIFDYLAGGEGDDLILGGDDGAWDMLLGGGGNDSLSGGLGGDWLEGGFGDDLYEINEAGDSIIGEDNPWGGRDKVYASIDYELPAGVEDLFMVFAPDGTRGTIGIGNALGNVIRGHAGDNNLEGRDGDDLLLGLGGDDVLVGGAGNDTLLGGRFEDVLIGGEGQDWFVLRPAIQWGLDRIVDFDAGWDRLILDPTHFKGLAVGAPLGALNFATREAYVANRDLYTESVLVWDQSRGWLFFDENGSDDLGPIRRLAAFDKRPGGDAFPVLTAADFIVADTEDPVDPLALPAIVEDSLFA